MNQLGSAYIGTEVANFIALVRAHHYPVQSRTQSNIYRGEAAVTYTSPAALLISATASLATASTAVSATVSAAPNRGSADATGSETLEWRSRSDLDMLRQQDEHPIAADIVSARVKAAAASWHDEQGSLDARAVRQAQRDLMSALAGRRLANGGKTLTSSLDVVFADAVRQELRE